MLRLLFFIHKYNIVNNTLKDSGEYFSGEKAREMIGMPPTSGDNPVEIARPDELLKTFMGFVQDRSPGSRFLSKGSHLLVHLEVRPELYTMYLYLYLYPERISTWRK